MASKETKPLASGKGLAAHSPAKGHGTHASLGHSERITRYSQCKNRSRQMARYLTELQHGLSVDHARVIAKLAANIRHCANYIEFRNYYTIGEIRLSKIMTCKVPMLCPFCANIRAAKNLQKYLERFDLLTSENPGLKPAFLTLTIHHTAQHDLMERFQHLHKCWRKYQDRRRDWFKKNRGFNELCKVDGAVFSYEITKGKHGWHPHIHILVLLTDWIDREQLSKEWLAITGDSKIVDIRRLKGKKRDDLIEAFCEIFKYTLKFSDLSLEDNFEAYENLKGKRLQGSFGSFWGVKVPEKDTDDLLDALPYLEMLYRYTGTAYTLETVCEKHADLTVTG